MFEFLYKPAIIAPPDYNRWLMAPCAVGIHICIGSVYAWSLINPLLTKRVGVVASSADDWLLSDAVKVFTIAILVLGLTAAIGGKWLEKVGPRMCGTVASFCWAGGFVVSAIGIEMGALWMIYLGYGIIGGIGLGLGYVTPVSTLIRWFPDRRGMATGIAIMGYGGGAMVAKFTLEPIMKIFYKPPVLIQTCSISELTTNSNGRRFCENQEVIIVTKNDQKSMLIREETGIYAVGSGDIGLSQAFLTLAVVYFVVMIISTFCIRVPASGWSPDGWKASDEDNIHFEDNKKSGLLSKLNIQPIQASVDVDKALIIPQFWYLWLILCFNTTAGIAVIAVAKTMMDEIFGSSLPDLVTTDFTSNYIVMISVFNLFGRFGWASGSDYLGRKLTFTIFFVTECLLYVLIPYIAGSVSGEPLDFWLYMFYGATMIIFTMYGGGFAVIPAYLADVFGTDFVGAIHGRLLTAWSLAGVLGPQILSVLRNMEVENAIDNLMKGVDPVKFNQTFGLPVDKLETLIESKTVTINSLLDILPESTIDPTPGLYNSTMYFMAGLLFLALILNVCMKPVDSKFYIKTDEDEEQKLKTTEI